MDFKLVPGADTIKAVIDTATVIEAGDIVAADGSKEIIKAVAGSTEIAYAVEASASGDTTIEITKGKVELIGTGDANFANSNKGTEVDLVVSSGTQLIDLGASATDVFRVSYADNAGTVGSTDDIRVYINKPLEF